MLSTTSSTTIAEDKAALRRQVRLTLEGLSPEAVRRGDDALFAAFSALPQVEAASTLFAFWGIPGREPDTGRLIRALTAQGKRVGLPRMLPGRQMEVRLYEPDRPLVPASFGILEPPADAPLLARPDIDLALVPAVCYDRSGFRLGFGGGYYDRWLSGFSGFTVGLCRDCVLQDRVPTEDHDCRVDLLLTETRRFLR
ncbi:MAG: 5-formyltetrahydrofolate cyclo-ligase [Oscillospiraceae bacterium]|mgnify:CR=1 FL=1|nr:5-formyltetrahydrofolate cyclo-ligase [Oscillospiraceae bacterium]